MKLKILDYIFSLKLERYQWAGEKQPHKWDFIFSVNWLSPSEKAHRECWTEENPGKTYPD